MSDKRKFRKYIIAFFIIVCLASFLFWRYTSPNLKDKIPVTDAFSSHEEKSINQENYNDLYIITYANEPFFVGLQNFVGSIHHLEPELRIVVYDLGMNENQIEDIKTWRNTQLFHFNFELYPPHVKSLYKYAWKMIILNETFHKFGNIFLEDSGQEFREKIDPIRDAIQEDGFYSLQSKEFERDKTVTHPLTEEYLGIKLNMPQLSGGILGLTKNHTQEKDIRKFVEDAVNCAIIEECIAPEGSSLQNHRYDQVVITLLVQKYQLKNRVATEICWVDSDGTSHPPLVREPEKNDAILCTRKQRGEQPYTQFLVRE